MYLREYEWGKGWRGGEGLWGIAFHPLCWLHCGARQGCVGSGFSHLRVRRVAIGQGLRSVMIGVIWGTVLRGVVWDVTYPPPHLNLASRCLSVHSKDIRLWLYYEQALCLLWSAQQTWIRVNLFVQYSFINLIDLVVTESWSWGCQQRGGSRCRQTVHWSLPHHGEDIFVGIKYIHRHK